MKNNIIFAGCSFTYGQGLWSYMPTDEHVPTYQEFIYGNIEPPSGSMEFKDSHRFANIVAHELDMNAITKTCNGGTDGESLDLIKFLFENSKDKHHDCFPPQIFTYDDVQHIVLQTSQVGRNQLEFIYDKCNYILKSPKDAKNLSELIKVVVHDNGDIEHQPMHDLTILYCWMHDFNHEVDDVIRLIQYDIVDRIEEEFKLYESQGIKTHILCWTDEYLEEFRNRDFIKDRLMKITYDNTEFDCLLDMFDIHPHLLIANDPTVIHDSGGDEHPSMECHRIIADSILKHLK